MRATALPVYFSFPAKQHRHSFSTTALEASLGVLQDRAGRGGPSTVWGAGSPCVSGTRWARAHPGRGDNSQGTKSPARCTLALSALSGGLSGQTVAGTGKVIESELPSPTPGEEPSQDFSTSAETSCIRTPPLHPGQLIQNRALAFPDSG